MKLVDFNNLANFGIEDPRMTTIAGVAFRELDRLPQTGDVVNLGDLEITVLEMDAHRISCVRVRRVAVVPETDDSADEGRAFEPEDADLPALDNSELEVEAGALPMPTQAERQAYDQDHHDEDDAEYDATDRDENGAPDESELSSRASGTQDARASDGSRTLPDAIPLRHEK
jgi:hypothetical protein